MADRSEERIVKVEDFHSAFLGNSRSIRIYLPPSYDSQPDKRYPVLYMHDGQGVFEVASFTKQSWDIHKTADRLVAEGKMREIFIIAVDNMGVDRQHEFSHTLDKNGITGAPDIECRGEQYERFLIEELKPYVDSRFRTLSDRKNTALMGSSMGGLVTYHIGLRNPDVFSQLGILSPYFCRLDLNTLQEIPFYKPIEVANPDKLKVWVDIGEVEANILVRHVRKVVGELVGQGFVPGESLMYYEVADAAHTEQDWARRAHAPLIYFFGDIGSPVSVEADGGADRNPVVTYSSGFVMTDLSRGLPSADDAGLARLTLRIHVPENTSPDAFAYVGRLKIPRISPTLFGGTFPLPRGIAIRFKIITDGGAHECLKDGTESPYRILRLQEDKEEDLTVEAWHYY